MANVLVMVSYHRTWHLAGKRATVADIQRWDVDMHGSMFESDDGPLVFHDDHLAAVAAAVTEEREASARAMGLTTAYSSSEALALLEAVAAIREALAHVISAEECDRRVAAAENDMALYAFNRALDKARGEIASWCKDNPRVCGECGDALAAIDALQTRDEGRNTE